MSAPQRSSAGNGVEVTELRADSDGGQINLARFSNPLHHDLQMIGKIGKSIFEERRIVDRRAVG